MKNYHDKVLLFFLYNSGLLLSGCISFQLPVGKISAAKNVKFNAPTEPFTEIKTSGSDLAWLSAKTGNTISYLSECSSNADSNLENLETDSLSVMNKVKILNSKNTKYLDVDSRQSIATGEVDGVPVQLSLVTFKKNGCTFTLSYGGVQKEFSNELNYFELFKESFKAP
jgi:hypothetical protein